MCYFLRRAHSTEQTPFTRVFPSGTHYSVETTKTTQIKCLPQGHNILMQQRIEPSISVFRNRLLAIVTNLPLDIAKNNPRSWDQRSDSPTHWPVRKSLLSMWTERWADVWRRDDRLSSLMRKSMAREEIFWICTTHVRWRWWWLEGSWKCRRLHDKNVHRPTSRHTHKSTKLRPLGVSSSAQRNRWWSPCHTDSTCFRWCIG